jgi:hypothetical protein
MKLALSILVVALIATSASAYTYIWSGAVSNLWVIPGNWTPIDGGTTIPQTSGDTAGFLASASVNTNLLTSLPNVSITGTLSLSVPTGTLQSPNGTVISGAGGLEIASGKVRFNQGASPNTFAGGLQVDSGATAFVSGGGEVIVPAAGGLTFNGGKVQWLADNVVADTCPVIWKAGTINFSTDIETMGTLQVLGNGSWNDIPGVSIHFANSSALAWTPGRMITIDYPAAVNDMTSIGDIYFGTNASALTAAQLADLQFDPVDPNTWNSWGTYYPAGLDANGRLIAVPEPMTMSLLLVGGLVGLIRRK